MEKLYFYNINANMQTLLDIREKLYFQKDKDNKDWLERNLKEIDLSLIKNKNDIAELYNIYDMLIMQRKDNLFIEL